MSRKYSQQAPPLWAAMLAACAAVLLFVYVRLYLYPDRLVPLAYALPLLLGLWHKNRGIHAAKTIAFCVIAGIQVFMLVAEEHQAVSPPAAMAMIAVNILTIGVVVDRLIVAQRRLYESMESLEQSNENLEAANAELVAREEEIAAQNEELQTQSDELEQHNEELQQQSEELQQQAEELQQQAGEMQLLNDEASGRLRVLHALLEASATPSSADGLRATAQSICEAALEATGGGVGGAHVVVWRDDALDVLGACGLDDPQEAVRSRQDYDDPLVATVMAERRTAAVEDLAQTPEVQPPCDKTGQTFRAALAAPILDGEQAIGAIVFYSSDVRQWTQGEFHIAEWLAAQAALVLKSARLQEELDRRRAEAEDASQRKTRFLAAVSHDVRTPANAISLTAEVIKRAGEDPQWASEIPELAESLRANANLLVELVSDVLDLARFDSGRVDVELSDFHLQEMVARELGQYRMLAQSAGLELTAACDAEPIWLRTDRMKLARVLGNLIGNAIKFTDRGAVVIRCQRTGDGAVEVQIEDTGVGIQESHLEHIFDEFYQIKNPERDRSKGTGLGLAICKRLVDAIGCALTLRSQFGQGTTFSIRVPAELVVEAPVDPVPAQQQQQPQETPAARPLAGVRVLLVEDHEATRTAFVRLLAEQGAIVDAASDGREALRMLTHHPPQVALVDLMLPDMDGREVLRRLARNRPAALRCLLAVSGDVTEERLLEIQRLGADGLAPKPLQIGHLVERIAAALDGGVDPSTDGNHRPSPVRR